MAATDIRENIVIVGGGTGATLARDLIAKVDHAKYHVVLINPRPFYAFLIASCRTLVTREGKLEDQIFIPFDRVLGDKGELVVGTVQAVRRASAGATGGHVVLDDGREVPFAILVLAPGSKWPGPLAYPNTREEVDAWVESWRNKVDGAQHIAIAGGGAVGIEFAGEIRHFHPSKRVTLVQKDKLLLNAAYPDKWRVRAEEKLRAIGVQVITDDALDENNTARTLGGKEINADLVIPAVGTSPNTDFVRSLGGDVLDDQGYIKVKPTLQLPRFPEIFAVGDAIDWKEQKQSVKANAHAAIAIANVLALTQGQTPTAIYKGSYELIVVTIGPNGGTAYFDVLWGIILGDWFSSFAKAKTLLVDKARALLGY